MTQPISIAPTGHVQLIGVRFQPGGAFPFFRIPMTDLTNCVVDLDAVDRRLQRELLSAALGAPLLSQKVNAIENALIQRARDFPSGSWILDLSATVVRGGGQNSIDKLASDAGVTVRQLQRRFLREVGIGPKLLSRILRFQLVFRAIESNPHGWAPVAADCGYYDQAHLIKDFQQFARQTPTVLLAHTSPLTELFTRKRRGSHFSKTSD
jgi:AraC-like DNA-binding protein